MNTWIEMKNLYSRLHSCDVCPRKCKVDRSKHRGVCGAEWNIKISNALLHFGEEPPISGKGGSGIIFFSGCPMKCVYCQNFGFSQHMRGVNLSEEELATVMLELQKAGAENINLVTASQYLPHVLKSLDIAFKKGLSIPLVWNTSSYESVESLKLLDGLIDIYLADIRYVEDEVGMRYSKVPDYWSVAKKALKEMFHQVGAFNGTKGMIIRILVFPNRITNHKKALDFIAYELSKDVPVSIMRQYMPVFRAKEYPEISRRITEEEYNEIVEYAENLGLNGWIQTDEPQVVPTKSVKSIYDLLRSKL